MAPIITPFRVTNLNDGETVHQRCLLVTGTYAFATVEGSYIHVTTKGENKDELFPEQTWPTADGNFKALVMLSPGLNILEFAYVCNECLEHTIEISVDYVPLLQYPPLHLAIMMAADSPCLIDCPPHKAGGLSSAHSDLDATVAKFRMTAYMWQAMTAEDMRLKGLGRRSFRLEEQWAADTVSRDFLNARLDGSLDQQGAMRSTAKVNVIRTPKTVKEIRNINCAQQNPSAYRANDLFDFFKDALKEAGGSFASDARPIVAGLILDSHYNITQNMILGHAALGCHDPNGISLGMFGSHLTYSWPRFLEEITACLTDTRRPGDKVGNDNDECGTMWEACTIGQGAHIHEVGHAFGSPHRPGIMERGYAQDWPKNFVSKTAYSSYLKKDGTKINETTPNNACWNLADALAFRMLPHFRIPSDLVMTAEERKASPVVHAQFDDLHEESNATLSITSSSGIARVSLNKREEAEPTVLTLATQLRYTESELEQRFDRTTPLQLHVLGFNGKETLIANVWRLLTAKSFIRIPESNLRLSKRSVIANDPHDLNGDNDEYYQWAQLLREKDSDGNLQRAISIDLRVGCLWDGGVVRYADGHKSHWGPMRHGGNQHRFGGHASEQIELPAGVAITCIEVNKDRDSRLSGVRMHLANGTVRGELNDNDYSQADIMKLEPAPNEVIIGFYGKSQKGGFCGVVEFGIITVPKDVGLDGLPEKVWDMSELKNTAGTEKGDEQGDDSQGSDNEDEIDYDEE